jgi:CubicO group peptidase (beta-lactamase class C family)
MTQDWDERLRLLADKHGVVGASLAVAHDGEVSTAATGVLNQRTGQPVTADGVFQIGSITKLFTAALVLQLVDEGLVDLDTPLVTYLPELRVRDEQVTRSVTARHLLAHTSGIDGDLFLDTGRGDDAVEKYVAALADVGQVHPLGATMSYCNSGYAVLGRLVEVLRGQTWDAALRQRLLAPMGLSSAGTLAEEALLHAAAVGHVPHPQTGDLVVTPQWAMYRGSGPAGQLHMTATEVLALAHLASGGAMPDGTRLLSPESVERMLSPQVAVPDPWTLGTHWGLGWILNTWDGRAVFGHDGATLGQGALFRTVPDAGVSVALLTNGGPARELWQDLATEVFASAGVEVPAVPAPRSDVPAFDASDYAGSYVREGVEMTVAPGEDALVLTIRNTNPLLLTVSPKPQVMTLLPYDKDVFLARAEGKTATAPAVFFALDDGSRYLHLGARSTPRRG